jgi:3-mercaptopyruvate sulfurtransferase SseA
LLDGGLVAWTAADGPVEPGETRFRPAAELAAALNSGGIRADRPVIAYCGGGISATVDLFALWLTGHDDARLDDGSLTEWSAHPDLPLVTGDQAPGLAHSCLSDQFHQSAGSHFRSWPSSGCP